MTDAYESAAEVLADRIAWAIESLAAIVEDATRRGWLTFASPLGTQSEAAAASLRARIDAHVARTQLDVRIARSEWLLDR